MAGNIISNESERQESTDKLGLRESGKLVDSVLEFRLAGWRGVGGCRVRDKWKVRWRSQSV
ncbi:hypothetical protein PISMIDRAFT_674545, partial [Pisolithus microcarpus 441]